MKKIILISSLVISTSVIAKPAYLNCIVSSEAKEGTKPEYVKFNVKLDEDTGKITHTHHDGDSYNVEGFFTANSISYQKTSELSGLKITYMHEIDRTTLEVKRTFIAEPSNPEFKDKIAPVTNELIGSCEIQKVEARKI